MLFSCGITDSSMHSSLGSRSSATSDHKRRRDRFGSAASCPKPLRSTASLMQASGISDADVTAVQLRCGVGALAPLKETLRKMFKSTVQKYCGIVPLGVLRGCCERHVVYMDGMLGGFTTKRVLFVPSFPSPKFLLYSVCSGA